MYLIKSGVVHYLYCVTFSGKDMQEKGWIKRGSYWLPFLPHLVLQEIVCRLSYRYVGEDKIGNQQRVSIDYYYIPHTTV